MRATQSGLEIVGCSFDKPHNLGFVSASDLKCNVEVRSFRPLKIFQCLLALQYPTKCINLTGVFDNRWFFVGAKQPKRKICKLLKVIPRNRRACYIRLRLYIYVKVL